MGLLPLSVEIAPPSLRQRDPPFHNAVKNPRRVGRVDVLGNVRFAIIDVGVGKATAACNIARGCTIVPVIANVNLAAISSARRRRAWWNVMVVRVGRTTKGTRLIQAD